MVSSTARASVEPSDADEGAAADAPTDGAPRRRAGRGQGGKGGTSQEVVTNLLRLSACRPACRPLFPSRDCHASAHPPAQVLPPRPAPGAAGPPRGPQGRGPLYSDLSASWPEGQPGHRNCHALSGRKAEMAGESIAFPGAPLTATSAREPHAERVCAFVMTAWTGRGGMGRRGKGYRGKKCERRLTQQGAKLGKRSEIFLIVLKKFQENFQIYFWRFFIKMYRKRIIPE